MQKKVSFLYFMLFVGVIGLQHTSGQFQKKTESHSTLTSLPPVVTASGDQVYCPLSLTRIVTDFSISNALQVDAVYVQISSGYVNTEDQLTLLGLHPNVSTQWDAQTGKLTLTSIGGLATLSEMILAVKDVAFLSSAPNPTGTRIFSISIGEANYLPSNGHYYLFVPNLGISWSAAKTAAESSSYYGLQGYLATITAVDESQLVGEQATGAGWIGGSDAEIEGQWKWVTGPEAGSLFWNNGPLLFAQWNTGEPNNLGDEDYAHITAPGIGITGSWNDLSVLGASGGDYQPKGYIVEYGGLPGDPLLSIAASTTLTMPTVTTTMNTFSICESGAVTITVNATGATVRWYDSATGETMLGLGNTFTTPVLSNSTSFFADTSPLGCTSFSRPEIAVIVTTRPTITLTNTTLSSCENTSVVLQATASHGIVQWFSSESSTIPIFNGTTFTTAPLSSSQDFLVWANDNGCTSTPKETVSVTVHPNPETVADSSLTICENENITLTAGLTNLAYIWSNGATSPQIEITTAGTYSVQMTNEFSCSTTQFFYVEEKAAPEVLEVIIRQNTAQILTNSGEFEYSLDGITFQDAAVFPLYESGQLVVHVREKNGCGYTTFPFAYLNFPTFFTPNNDGVNDIWFAKGWELFPQANVQIFDRFGKLLNVMNRNNPSWDGTYEGKPLPSNDYWFRLTIAPTQREQLGHFSLKR